MGQYLSRSDSREKRARNFPASCECEDTLIRLRGIRSVGSTDASGLPSRMREGGGIIVSGDDRDSFRKTRVHRETEPVEPKKIRVCLIFFFNASLSTRPPLSPSKVSVYGN